jgi:hypothetical protein
MRQLLTTLLLIFSTVCSGQTPASDFALSLDFAPSFIAPCKVTIFCKPDSNRIEFTIYKDINNGDMGLKTQAALARTDLNTLEDFLKNYQFSKNSWRDKLGTDTIVFEGKTMVVNTGGLDGITVNGSFTQNNDGREFSFWSPRKGSENNKLVKLIFTLLCKSFPEEKIINYIEQLEGYFPFGLGLKKISDNPLKYKLYGAITSHEEKEITSFINNLPSDRDVFIDLSNFNGMGTMFYPLFKSLTAKNKRIYWVKPSPKGLQQLCEIGVPMENILN